jgi:hypothetical protein
MSQEPLRFSGQLTIEDYLQIYKVATPAWARLFPFVFASVFLLTIVINWKAIPWDRSSVIQLILIAAFLALVVLPRVAMRRSWKKNTSMNGPISGIVDEENVEWNGQFTQTKFPWTAIQKRRGNENLLLLYTGGNSVMFFAKRFFADDASWQRFVALANEKVRR